MIQRLKPEQLRRTYDPASLPFNTDEDKAPAKTIIGQARAVRALQFGLGNKSHGFNIYVAGIPGTGKQTAVLHFLQDLAKTEPSPCDWCYVNNFQDPYYPKKLSLPKGQAHEFRNDVRHFLMQANTALIKIFESDEFARKRDEIFQKMHDEEADIFAELNEKASRENLIIQRTPLEIMALPRVKNRAMSEKEFLALSDREREAIVEKQRRFKDELRLAARQTKGMDLQFNKLMLELERKAAIQALDVLLEELESKYALLKDVLTFLRDLKNDLLEHLKEFIEFSSKKAGNQPAPQSGKSNSIPRRYDVNVIVDNRKVEGAPIMLEINPTYNNLFGKIEKESMMGTFITDFTLIRSGSLHKANGGYLILPMEELLRNYFSWDSLKRALRTNTIDIEEPGERLGFLTGKSLKPEPIPLHIQVILIGKPLYYYLLHYYDEDFKELFKVKADFDTVMDYNDGNIKDFVQFIRFVGQGEEMLPMDAAGMAKLLEHSHRLAEDQEKISTRFGEIIDLVREANHYAGQKKAEFISAEHIQSAARERIYRSSLLKEKIREMIEKDLIFIDLDGEITGQVNGLSYIGMGDISFGRPSRITASVSVGQSGIVDIEREVKLGGPIHSKGVMILTGYLAEKFGQDKTISLSAQLVFEQSYSEIEGDSASSAELYALLSSLSGLPVKQGIAVSGSVNQKGEVQAVGGINEKIEGFFDICEMKGLTGKQGVIIPKSNMKHLMLKHEVVEAVIAKKFNLWAIDTIGEGIEILTGVKAGKLLPESPDGKLAFEEGSVFEKVNTRLLGISEILQSERQPNLPKLRRTLWRQVRRRRR